jgi:hypothetical protein
LPRAELLGRPRTASVDPELRADLQRLAGETPDDLGPEEAAVSVVTLAELQAGVLAARDTATRARRMATLDVVSDIELPPIHADAAPAVVRVRSG